ncbi:MAG TPA: DUF2339 domain-containing protein [Thermoanaerobaculia bacterium]|nr:DUF2339 domain-containing protein [Thermoanaerobaculia bacterium]
MEGCAIFVVFVIAIIALVAAVRLRSRLNAAEEDTKMLATEVAVLQRLVREMRRDSSSEFPGVPRGSSEGPAPAAREPEPQPEPVIVAPSPIEPIAPVPVVPEPEQAPIEPPPYVPPTPPPPPPPPAAPAWSFDWENLVGIKLFSWIAGIALVLAAVFFLKYSVEHGWLSPAIRATLGIITGATLLVICELRVARNYTFTANAMHGAGIAILYATLFAIHALWHLAPAGLVFFLMLVVTAVAVGLSIRRDSMFIALLGLMGGFATPALLSTGQNRPVGLFSYLLLLNVGLAWVAYRKRWPALTIGSLAFTVFYQWGWVGKYLTAAQLPLAAGIFIVFAALAASALWIARRGHDDPGKSIFERVSLVAIVLPLAFGIFTAAVPAYGARYNTLFGFLLLVAAGLAFIAVASEKRWLHAIGGGAVLLTFAIWSAVSYVSDAWPAVLGWIAAFVVLYLFVATRMLTRASFTAPLLFFMLPALLVLEPRAASPSLLFATFFVLLAAVAFVGVRYEQGPLYFVASFFVIIGEAIWSAKHLTADRLYAALLLYAAFGLLFLGVPAIARRYGRELTPRAGSAITAIVSLAMLLFLTIDEVASDALWGLTALLAILLAGSIVESKIGRRPIVAIVSMVLTWIVLGSWWEGIDLKMSLIPALFTVAAFGILALLATIWANRDADSPAFAHSSHLALVGYVFLFVIAIQKALAFPPWPLFAVLAILTLAIGVASLYLRLGTLTVGGALGAQLVLLTWTSHALIPPWANTGLVATLLIAAFAYVWMFLAERVLGREGATQFHAAAAAALLMGHAVAIGVGSSARPLPYAMLLATHALLGIATLALAWRTETHALALFSVVLTSIATAMAPQMAPSRAFTFAVLPYALYMVYPLLLGARVKRSLQPYLAAVIASATFFFFARDAMVRADLNSMIGVLPVAQAIVLMIVLLRLLRSEPAETRDLGRLAIVAGAALAFITAAIPLQLDKQWITIGWALEGAALVWLFTRIPHRGLVAWAGALLIAAFVRLVFNPAVLNYHASSGRAIINWYLYTYLVAAASFFIAAYWLPRAWKRSIAATSAMGTVLLFVLLNIEIADYFSSGTTLTFNFFSSSLAQELTYTIGWAIFAVAMLIAGIALHAKPARVAALILLLVTILKCFLHDLSRLGGLYRVASLLGLALALVAVGVLLQKYVIARPAARAALLALLITSQLFAAVERTVSPGAAGPNRLDVDVALLSNAASDLRDLRLYDDAKREIGYLLVDPEPGTPRWIDGRMLPVAATKKTSGFEIDLGRAEDIDRLRFENIASPFLKRVRVEGSGDRGRWTLLADATVFDLPDEKLTRLDAGFEHGRYRYLRVTWDDASSARIARVGGVRARVHNSGASPEPLRASLPFRKRASEPRISRYRVDLPGARMPLAAIELRVANGNVFRTVTITEPRLGNGEVLPSTLGSGTVRRAERWGAVAEAMGVEIERPTGRQIDLVIDDGDNPALVLTHVIARFAPQPWIYFESPGITPLTARYGDARLEPPRYDLEASRRFLASAKPAIATWANTSMIAPAAATEDVRALQGAVVDRSAFGVVRAIPRAPAGLTVLLMDADVLARSRELSDVRIAGENDRQIPYVVEKRDEPLVVPLTLQEARGEKGTTVYRLALPYTTLPYGTRLVLRTTARVFERSVDLRGVTTRIWRAADPELLPPALTFEPPLSGNEALEVVVHEGDNATLPITRAELLLPSVALRFHHPGTPISLLYGNRELAAPRYDLALLAPRLFAQSARELTLSPQSSKNATSRESDARNFFWIAIGIVAVVLLVLLAKLLKPAAVSASD